MELVVELLVGLLQLLGELLLQILFEIAAELGLHSVKEVFEKRPNPALASIGYAILGALAGGLSLLVFPSLLISNPTSRVANLVFTPLTSGLVMAAFGAWRKRRDQELVRLDRFGYGLLFALSMALIRYFGARGV